MISVRCWHIRSYRNMTKAQAIWKGVLLSPISWKLIQDCFVYSEPLSSASCQHQVGSSSPLLQELPTGLAGLHLPLLGCCRVSMLISYWKAMMSGLHLRGPPWFLLGDAKALSKPMEAEGSCLPLKEGDGLRFRNMKRNHSLSQGDSAQPHWLPAHATPGEGGYREQNENLKATLFALMESHGNGNSSVFPNLPDWWCLLFSFQRDTNAHWENKLFQF